MNKVMLMGRFTKDPEIRYTSTNNMAICRFSLAVDRRFAKQGEEKQADFITVVAFDKQAEFCSKYFQKGSKIGLFGRIQTRTWDDNEGKRHYETEVLAEELYFVESKKSDAAPSRFPGSNDAPTDGFYPMQDNDDELPF